MPQNWQVVKSCHVCYKGPRAPKGSKRAMNRMREQECCCSLGRLTQLTIIHRTQDLERLMASMGLCKLSSCNLPYKTMDYVWYTSRGSSHKWSHFELWFNSWLLPTRLHDQAHARQRWNNAAYSTCTVYFRNTAQYYCHLLSMFASHATYATSVYFTQLIMQYMRYMAHKGLCLLVMFALPQAQLPHRRGTTEELYCISILYHLRFLSPSFSSLH